MLMLFFIALKGFQNIAQRGPRGIVGMIGMLPRLEVT